MKRERYKSLFDQERKEVNEDFEDDFYNDGDFEDMNNDDIVVPSIDHHPSIFDREPIIDDDDYQFESAPKKRVKEAVNIKEVIDELIDTNWSGSNEEQMKAVQLLKGLATSEDPLSNKFMKALDKATSGMKKDDFK